MRVRLFLSGCIVVLVSAQLQPALPASGAAAETAPGGPEKEMIQLNFPEGLEVKVLVEYVSKRLGINILYDDKVARRRVTISAPTKIPKDSLAGLLDSVLKMAGLMMIDDDQPGWKRIVESKDFLTLTKQMERDVGQLAKAASMTILTQVFQLSHVTTASVSQLAGPLLSKPGGNSFSIPERGLMVITDYAGNLRRIRELIELLDQPGPEAIIRFVRVEHLDATALASQVGALLAEKDRVAAEQGKRPRRRLTLTPDPRTNRIAVISADGSDAEAVELIEALDVPTDAVTRTYQFRHVSPQRIEKLARNLAGPRLKDRVHTTVDAESGLLVVTAREKFHEQIRSLQEQLDRVETAAELQYVQFYKLTNTTAAQVLGTIRALAGSEEGLAALAIERSGSSSAQPKKESFTGPNKPPAGMGQELPTPPAYKPRKGGQNSAATQPVDVEAPSRLATAKVGDAIVTADPNTNTIIVAGPPAIQRIYRELIKRLDRRRPQVLIEVTLVTLDTTDNFSLGVELSRRDSFGRGNEYLTFSAFGLGSVDLSTGAQTLTPGVGFNGVLVGPDTVNVVLKALTTDAHSKVLAAPRVLVNDNATATLSSIAEAPFTSINASETVATTSFAGYASAGTTLTVTPHISEGDHLQLNYSITLNSFTGEGSAAVPPPRQTNSLNSEVTIPDGYAIIVGGLTRQDVSSSVARVPWLGKIPILEYLLSSRSDNESQSTLFAFIRPVILRDDQFEDLKCLSELDLRRAELPGNLPTGEPMIMQ